MKKSPIYLALIAAGLLQSGCYPEFWGGAAAGVLGAGAGYEYQAKRQMGQDRGRL